MGYDKCGNICGTRNKRHFVSGCGPNDKTNEAILNLDLGRCESSCNFKSFGNRCFSNPVKVNDFVLMFIDLKNALPLFAISTFITLMFTFVLYSLYRYATKYVVYGFYTLLIILLAGFSVMCFIKSHLTKFEKTTYKASPDSSFFIFFGCVSVVALIISVIYMMNIRKRIPLVIQMFKEASVALSDTPMLLAEPLLTFISFILTCMAFTFAAITIESSGRLIKQPTYLSIIVDYKKDFGMIIARYLNIIAFIWFSHFLLGCQHFVVAGTVSQWYFTRTKSKLIQPIKRSFSHLLHFHLGSICFGSILITATTIFRILMNALSNSMKQSDHFLMRIVGFIFQLIAIQLERFMIYIVRNAYIMVAKDGILMGKFWDSGKKAVDLLTNNLVDVIALNAVAHFVLFLGKAVVLTIFGFVSYELLSINPKIHDPFVTTMVFIVLLYLIVHIFMSVFDMALNTIFICFCEDCEVNDGILRPYFMSAEMMIVRKQLESYVLLKILKHITSELKYNVESNAESSVE